MKLRNLFAGKKDEADPSSLSAFLHQMLLGVKKLGEKVATDIMIPRVDVTTIYLGQPLEEVIGSMREHGYSRFPVWKEKLDNVVGVLYAKDLLYRLEKDQEYSTIKRKVISEDMLREPFFIPESKKIESLLKEFKSKKVHMAIVLDEYGGFSGVVTLENIIEIIIGDIQDEYDFEQEEIKKITDNIYEVDARTLLEDLEEGLGLNFGEHKEEIDTLGGLIYNTLEHVPQMGEEMEINKVLYQVIRTEGNKILSIKLKLPAVMADEGK